MEKNIKKFIASWLTGSVEKNSTIIKGIFNKEVS